jgi:hypothetical protein
MARCYDRAVPCEAAREGVAVCRVTAIRVIMHVCVRSVPDVCIARHQDLYIRLVQCRKGELTRLTGEDWYQSLPPSPERFTRLAWKPQPHVS